MVSGLALLAVVWALVAALYVTARPVRPAACLKDGTTPTSPEFKACMTRQRDLVGRRRMATVGLPSAVGIAALLAAAAAGYQLSMVQAMVALGILGLGGLLLGMVLMAAGVMSPL